MSTNKLLLLAVILLVFACRPRPSSYEQYGLEEITITELQQGYANNHYSVAEVTEAYLERIEKLDQNGPELNSMLYLNPHALETAQKLDDELKQGNSRGPLHGVPIVLKDNINTYDMPTTAGARAMEGIIPPDDAFITAKLREAGAVILGKSNLSEWANFHSSFSSSGWSALGGQTRNPYDLSRNPCGSSSGPAVATSANLAVVGIGTETNGSITCPSTANGLVGIKPTVGLLSRSGIIPISFTQDTPGPMSRTVRDAAITLGTMVGVDEADTTTADSRGRFFTDYTQFLIENGLKGKRLGYWTGPSGDHHRVDTLMQKTIRHLKTQGAAIVELESIVDEDIGSDSFQVLLYEFKDGLNNYFKSLGERAPVKNLAELIEVTLADSIEMHYYDHDLLLRANKKDNLNSKEYVSALERMLKYTRREGIDKVMAEHNLDAIVSPTGSPAWKTDLINGDHFSVSSSSPAARAGYPNITVPMGHIDNLPVGISFFGRAWSEPKLIEIAYAFEQSTKVRRAPEFRKTINK